MVALLMYLKQPNFIYLCAYIWLATLAVANAGSGFTDLIKSQSKTEVQASEPIEVAALGRPLSLGMLYDCRKDSFIPGVTLWDEKSLSENLHVKHQTETNLDFSSTDSISSKSSLLDVSASLKASFLAGLVEVGGSGRFLQDTKSSNQQSRVTMFYSETTRFEGLTMSQLDHFTYREVFEKKSATHVITAVLYGAQAFMVFDRTFSKEETKQEIEGELNVMVKNIPSYSIEGNGSVNMKEDEKNKVEKIACTFHGDVRLQQNPTTYMEALQTYKKLPDLLKDPQNAVPIKVWLYPLHLLESKAARLEREISTSLISDTESIIEELEEAERTYNDLFKHTLVNAFSDIKERMQLFQSLVSTYKTMLIEAVGKVLPAIRGGEMEDKSLEDILKNHRTSPFSADKLNQWLHDAKSELYLLSSLTKSLEGVQIKDSEVDIMIQFFNPDVNAVVCLTLTSLKYEDKYLSTLKKFLQSDVVNDKNVSFFSVESFRKWFSDHNVFKNMIENSSQFRRMAEANKNEKRIRFFISAISNPNIAGSSIYLYEKGKLADTQFKPMSKPPPPIVRNVQAQAVSLRLQTSSSRERVQYRVEYKQVKPQSRAEEPWSSKATYDEDITLTGLELGKHYLIRYRIVGEVGVSEASDSVSTILSADPSNVVRFAGFFSTLKAMSWSDSRQFCRDHGGDLVIIKSTQKQNLVYTLAKEMDVSFWIGLYDLENKGHMKWVDNSPLNQAFWRRGEPNDLNGNEDCVVLNPRPVMNSWNDMPCFESSHFICE